MAIEIDDLKLLETRLEIEALNTDFCYYLDHGHVAKLVEEAGMARWNHTPG